MNSVDVDDLLSAEVVRDPYPVFRRLRESDPVHWNPRWEGWVLTRYADIQTVMHDPRFSSDRYTPYAQSRKTSDDARAVFGVLSNWLGSQDPPLHTRLRASVQKAFTPKRVQGVRPSVERITDDLLHSLPGRGRVDLMRDYAFPLPARVIASLLGMPEEDIHLIRDWSADIAPVMFLMFGEKDRNRRARTALERMTTYFAPLVESRRSEPVDDLISALAGLEARGELSREEVLATCMVVIFGGQETTMNLVGNGLLALLQHTEQMERLRSNPGLVEAAVEELLRFDGPAKTTVRWARETLDVDGHTIQAGQRILVCWSAGNRDPEKFPEPDRLDLSRAPNPHLAFGHGIHYCIGGPLARIEAQIALRGLLDRYPGLALDEEADRLEWNPTIVIRGLKSLPVRLNG